MEVTDEVVPGLTFVVPAYNEENGILPTLERLKETLAGLDIPTEIILVNDGSKDRTVEMASKCPGVRVVSHPINTGYGSALKTGIVCARYQWIGIVDADSTYDMGLIPTLVERMKDGFDMVVAARTNVLELDKPLKRFFRKTLLTFLKLIVANRIEDPNSGLRIFHRDVALTFFPFLCNTFSFTTSITIFALGEGYFVTYVPMNYSKREGKSKVRHVRDSLRMMQLILQGITFFNPVKFCIMLAVALVLAGGLPAAVMGALGMPLLGMGYLALTAVCALLMALGTVADIVRITGSTSIQKKRTLRSDTGKLIEISAEFADV